MFDANDLVGDDGIREVRQDGPRHFRVVVDHAGEALPAVVERIRIAGVEVASAREYRLSFDEIFGVLVGRHNDPAEGELAGSGDGPATTNGVEAAA